MNEMTLGTKRTVAVLAVCAVGLLAGCATTPETAVLDNDGFYADGAFDGAKAKQAYIDMMNRFDYPVPESFAGDQLWAIDFGLGDFSKVGMGGVFWVNENHEGGGYLGHEIFLLPGQMIVEHSHVACDTCPPKRESWLVRHGSAYSFSVQDEPVPFPEGVEIPESEKEFSHVNACVLVSAGELDTLNKAGEWHFLMGGPEGCIVSEFATFHDNDGLRFSNPDVQF